jgi:lysophospholipase L1-like esterase
VERGFIADGVVMTDRSGGRPCGADPVSPIAPVPILSGWRWTGRAILWVLTLAAIAAGSPAWSQGTPQWIETWAAGPQQPIDPVIGSEQTPPTLNGQTIRQVVRISAGGGWFLLRLTNEFTDAPILIGEVHVAVSAANGGPSSAIVPGTDHAVTFGGNASIILAPNAPALSDPVEIPMVPALTSLAISIYVASSTQAATVHTRGMQTAYITSGDSTGATDLPRAITTQSRYILSGVAVADAGQGAAIVTLGDSITDGYNSTADADRRWPDILAQRLQSRSLGNHAVANEGISGNRLRLEGIGPSAHSRFDRDVLSRPGVRYVTVLEGINDIGFPVAFPNSGPAPTAQDIIGVYRELIARAHQYGVLIYGATLTPFQGAGYYSATGEATREAVNDWIRNSREFDDVIDFDGAVRDPANPLQFLPVYDSGDHLHPSDAGYDAMARSVNLELFTRQFPHP